MQVFFCIKCTFAKTTEIGKHISRVSEGGFDMQTYSPSPSVEVGFLCPCRVTSGKDQEDPTTRQYAVLSLLDCTSSLAHRTLSHPFGIGIPQMPRKFHSQKQYDFMKMYE